MIEFYLGICRMSVEYMLRFFLLISVGATMLLPRVGIKDVTLLNGVDGIFRLKFLGFMAKRVKTDRV